ncbi:MAG: DNA excision repair protein ERCC-2 [Lentisphaeria bacterium]|jgi:DNA excision repair protein ERCC-2
MLNGKHKITVGVTDLVNFSVRSGDLWFESDGPSAKEGTYGHIKIQKYRGDEWQTEVHLKQNIASEEFIVQLQGRLDVLYEHEQVPIIEEIKTTYLPVDFLPSAKQELHWAQQKILLVLK